MKLDSICNFKLIFRGAGVGGARGVISGLSDNGPNY